MTQSNRPWRNVELSEEAERFLDCVRKIADRQVLLIMRELSMNVRRFQDIQAQTRISPNLLSSRLRRLEKEGIIERRPYSVRPLRHEYYATPKGKGLDEILFAAGNWDILWGYHDPDDEPSIAVYDKVTGKRLGPMPPRRPRARKVTKT